MRENASKPVNDRKNRFWPGAHPDVIRQVHPADRACGINEKFGRPRDVMSLSPPVGVQHSVQPDRLCLGI